MLAAVGSAVDIDRTPAQSLVHGSRPSFSIVTLGCKANQYDSQQIARALVAGGLRQVPFDVPADVYVIDTCTVTGVADHKSRKLVRRAVAMRPDAIIAVTGCAAAWAADQYRQIAHVDIVLGNAEKARLPRIILDAMTDRLTHGCGSGYDPDAEAEPAPLDAGLQRTRAVLKIQEGCNHGCTYCIIPRTRGREVTKSLSESVTEAAGLVAEGHKEIVLTGIRLGGYGSDCGDKRGRLARCVAAIADVPGLLRLRLSSIDPIDVDDELLDVLDGRDNVCAHLHLPLQSGDNEILTAMRRGYSREDYRDLVLRARRRAPEAGITADVMVGFPGETEAHFLNTYRLIEELELSRLHVFPYSPRPRTLAARLPGQVSKAEKQDRNARLIDLGTRLQQRFAECHIGRTWRVLLEREDAASGCYEGLTDGYVRTFVQGDGLRAGMMVLAAADRADHGCLYGTVESVTHY